MILQADVDRQNAAFWSELCGSGIARVLGITGEGPDDLRRFDDWYFDYYPYLKKHVDRFDLVGKNALEIGLGYGTLGQYLAECGALYHGLDIAPTPVEMMRHRLRMAGGPADERVLQGSALEMPFPAETFDYLYSIGCLHHTGDLARSIAEVHRVLKPGGVAVLMLYNRYSWRQLWRVDRRRLAALIRTGRMPSAEEIRAYYDKNAAGDAAPHTDFTSRRGVRRLLRDFARVEVEAENFDALRFPRRRRIERERLIEGPIARLLGLDLYITATK